MRLAYVSTRSDTPGGSNTHIRDLAVSLRERGHEVAVFGGGDGVWAADVRRRGLRYHPLRHLLRPIRPHHDVAAVLELRSALRRFGPDLVSLHTAKAGFVGRVAALGLGAPVVYTPHGWPFTSGVPARAAAFYAGLERIAAPLATCIVNVCDFERQIALARGVGNTRAHEVVHNGMPDVDPSLRADPAAQPPRMVMIARFEEQKDHTTLLHALATCRDLPWGIGLIGSGPLEGEARHLCATLGLTERVAFLGTRDDVAQLLARAQLFVLASRWEGFPRSILEAMRAGLPVVASAVGGVHEAVTDGVTGFVVAPRDVTSLAARLRSLLTDPDLRASFGDEGRERYQARFTFDAMLQRTLAVYARLGLPT